MRAWHTSATLGGSVVDFTALGDPVNVSARMQQHAAGGELLVACWSGRRAHGESTAARAEPARARAADRRLRPRHGRHPTELRPVQMRRLPSQATGSRRRTPSCSGRSGSILMPSSSQVPLMAPTMIVVRCATNSSGGIRRGLSSLEPQPPVGRRCRRLRRSRTPRARSPRRRAPSRAARC